MGNCPSLLDKHLAETISFTYHLEYERARSTKDLTFHTWIGQEETQLSSFPSNISNLDTCL